MPILLLCNIAFIAFFIPLNARAQVVFSEIMYDIPGSDSGREWVEVRNNGVEAVDLTNWRFFEANVNHKLIGEGASVLEPNGYAVIADNSELFRADWSDFSGILFESAFSLSNTGETLILKDELLTSVVSISYESTSGADGDGNSLNEERGVWVPRTPTPGALNTNQRIIIEESEKPDGNLPEISAVTEDKSADPGLDSDVTDKGEYALASQSFESEGTPSIFPWIAALLAVILLGIGSLVMGKRKSISGYTITEEKS